MEELVVEQCKGILEYCSDAVVLFDNRGVAVYQNPVFRALPVSTQHLLASCHDSGNFRVAGYTIHFSDLDSGTVLIAHEERPLSQAEQVLSHLLETLEHTADVYAAAVMAIHQALGWRWVSISRFNQGTVDVLAHCSDGILSDTFQFELAGAPCEVVARSGKYTLFSDVGSAFPDNAILQQLGAKCYAGLVYTDRDNKPIGHIMAIHDDRQVDYRMAEQVLALSALAVSSRLMLDDVERQLSESQHLARIDGLTQLYNRAFFDDHVNRAIECYQRNGTDVCLALIDLDNFKQYNDSFGHCDGDRLLKMLAVELMKIGRDSDMAFRIGGDEFALIFPDAEQPLISRIERQFRDSLERLSLVTGRKISASIGFSMLSESNDASDWHNRADVQMYDYKRSAD